MAPRRPPPGPYACWDAPPTHPIVSPTLARHQPGITPHYHIVRSVGIGLTPCWCCLSCAKDVSHATSRPSPPWPAPAWPLRTIGDLPAPSPASEYSFTTEYFLTIAGCHAATPSYPNSAIPATIAGISIPSRASPTTTATTSTRSPSPLVRVTASCLWSGHHGSPGTVSRLATPRDPLAHAN